jgi:hypothetical protein
VALQGFRPPGAGSFDADGERRVSASHSVWFRNGGRGLSAANRRQLKIYTESNHWGFSQIFGDLSSTQTLAIYQRLLVRN